MITQATTARPDIRGRRRLAAIQAQSSTLAMKNRRNSTVGTSAPAA